MDKEVPSSSHQVDNQDKRSRFTGGDGDKEGKAKSSRSCFNAEIVKWKDNQQLIAIFPEEVWKIILEAVKDPNDLENISNASLFFRNLLSSRRVEFLFYKVFKALHIYEHKKASLSPKLLEEVKSGYRASDYKRCSTCSRWIPSSWTHATFTLRLICRSWSASIDELAHDNRAYRRPSYYPKEEVVCPVQKTDVKFHDRIPQDVLSFLRRFQRTHYSESESTNNRSPFISRYVCFVIRCGFNGQMHISNELSKLLSKYGHHIWYLDLRIRSGSTILFYRYLVEMLTLLPNLRELQVDCIDDRLVECQITESSIRLRPLPKLGSLHYISTTASPVPVLKELIRSYNQITMLKVEAHDESKIRADYEFHSSPLPYLEQLSMIVRSLAEFEALTHSEVTWSNLKTLDLSFNNEYIKWSYIFRKLEKWAETLTCLTIDLPKASKQNHENRIVEKCVFERLKLPGITNLDLWIRNLSSLEFILPMRNTLEFLDIKLEFEVDKRRKPPLLFLALESGQSLKLLIYYDKLWKSNVWTLFPKLKAVRVAIYQNDERVVVSECTRKKWEQKNAEM